ncbi:MAG: hypothetical protein ACRER5_22630, partial [Pseudomonas sp.]
EDARRLARAYVQERDEIGVQQPTMPALPPGFVLEQSGTPPLPPGFQLEQPQPKADFSGVSGAVNSTAAVAPSGMADFSGVSSRVDTTATSMVGPQYNGPLLSPSTQPQRAVPTLGQVNAANRATMADPGFRQRQDAETLARRQDAFQRAPAPVRALAGAGSAVGNTAMGLGQLAGLADGADVAAMRDRNRNMEGDLAAGIGRVGGEIGLMALPAGAVTRAAGTTGKAALAANTALGAGYAGLQPVVEGESRGRNALVGGAFGAAGQGAATGLASLGRRATNAVAPEVRQLAQRARDLGIPLHVAQVSDSLPVKVAASAGKYLPFSGYGKAASRQQDAFNRAVAKTFGVDATKLSDDVMQRARREMSKRFEDVYNRNSIPLNETAGRRLAAVERDAVRRLTKDEGAVLRNQLDDILENADGGVLTGQKYQAVRTALRKAEGNDKLGMAVRELRMTLDDIAADAVGPGDSAALKELRSQWANFRTVENALKQVSGASGDIRPASLWPLIRKGSTKEMRELARIGQTLLKDPIADSGTAQRTLAYNLLMGGGSVANPALIPLIAKAALGGATLGRAANSNSLASLITRESRGKPTSKLAELMGLANPYAAPTAGVEFNRQQQQTER